jgi:hypothetical protein
VDGLAQRFAEQGHLLQVGHEPVLGPIVGVTDAVADLDRLAGEFATPRHRFERPYLYEETLGARQARDTEGCAV